MKKSLILYCFLNLIILISCKKEPGKISGVITYFFNDNFGDKPDVGSKIFIVPADEVDTNYEKNVIEEKQNLVNDQKKLNEHWDKLKTTYNISDVDQFIRLDEKTKDFIDVYKKSKNIKEFAANGNGNFFSTLPAGDYYVLVESSHRTGNSRTEKSHKLDMRLITIDPAGEKTVNVKF